MAHRSHSPAARRGLLHLTLVAAMTVGTVLLGAPAHAATGNIDHVETTDDALQVIFSVADVPEGVSPDLGTVTAMFDGEPVPATAEPLADAGERIRRTAILAMDVSNSMARNNKFAEAKAAANAFLDEVPDDVYVGIVTFAGQVEVAQRPTQDTEAVRAVVDGLTLSRGTRLYDGLVETTKVIGAEGARSVVVLSDGRNTGPTPIEDATNAVSEAEVKVDVVALGQTPADTALLEELAEAGAGTVIPADDPAALSEVFAAEAEALARQILVTLTPDAALAGQEGSLEVTFQVDGQPTSDEAFIAIPGGAGAGGVGFDTDVRAVETETLISKELMFAGLAAAAVALVFMVVIAMGGASANQKQDAVDKSIEAYTRQGAKKLAAANRQPQNATVTQQAVAVAEGMLEGQKGIESALAHRLEAAGLALKPAEWLLLHFGVAVGFGMAGLLLGGGSVLWMLLGLFFGLAAPWAYLMFAQRRRLSAFKGQLADTLQLMAGSLSAGMSLLQSVDTVVREGSDPIAGEFRRALVQSRLGVEIEDGLSDVAARMHSVDFEWVVMAIRIQRDVGGNLAELLNKVAETIREREYLERQVRTLSAEGRLSVWVLGGLPPAFVAYLAVANPTYLSPMFTHPLGWLMLGVSVVLLTVGIFWMTRLVKVDA